MKPTDIAELIGVGIPTLSPDGRTAVVATSQADLAEDDYVTRLWSVAVDGSTPPRQLTHGRSDGAPAFSPDGQWIAFRRAEKEGKPQVWLLPTAGGDAKQLTDLKTGAGAPRWSPDSTRIAFSARVPEPGRYGTEEKVTPDKEPPRRITSFRFKGDGTGFTLDRPEQVFVVDVATGETTQLTHGAQSSGEVAWSPDGAWIAFTVDQPDAWVVDVCVIRPDGSDQRTVTDGTLSAMSPAFTRDGTSILLAAEDPEPGQQLIAKNAGLWIVDAATGGRPTRLTEPERWNLSEGGLGVLDGAALVPVQHRGAVDLVRVPFDGSGPEWVSQGLRQVTGLAVAGEAVVVAYKDPTTAGELGVLTDGRITPLTSFSKGLTPRPIDDLTATAPDGQALHGFVVTPEGAGPHPTLLMIHGGPFTQYGWTLFDEAQVYAAAGYAVVYTNPRGSSGYGEAYGQWIRGDVGARSQTDLFALLDAALERPDLDGTRLGVLGGSHGGFMTTWIVGHSDRFLAAVSERAVNAIDSFTGSSDIGWGFADDLYGPDPDEQRRQSPLTYVDDITTPVLIVHSEEDWRCPVEQAQRLFVALRQRGKVAEMLLFPAEGHELSRSGLPSHRVARFEAIVEWFDRWIV